MFGRVVDDAVCQQCQTFAIFYTKVHNRVLRPLLPITEPQTPPPLRSALRIINQHINARFTDARLPRRLPDTLTNAKI